MIITNYIENNTENTPPMPQPLRGITKSAAGNITLTFKTLEDASRARVHANEWIRHIDMGATTPQRSYTVVAHNSPTDIWTEAEDFADAIDSLELSNPTDLPDGRQIANLAWLNSSEARDKTKRGPLLVSYKTKEAANDAIENGLVIEGVLCSVSLYIPRPLNAFGAKTGATKRRGVQGGSMWLMR
jgi:hypothetical protein